MRMTSFASGSSGNCIYVGSDNTHILIDTGIAYKRIEAGLNDIGLKGQDLQGIFVTHEHSDHVCGLGVLARKLGIPMYGSQGTIEALKQCKSLGKVDESLYRIIKPDEDFILGDLTIKPFSNTHDAAQPLGYRVEQGHRSVAVCTDLGNYSQYTVSKLQGLDAILLESNHDIHMLQVGGYPYPLKQRILGDRGHLSNESAGKLLCHLLHDNLKAVFLGHLSKENNYEELAFETVKLEIAFGSDKYKPDDFLIEVAKRDSVSRMMEF